MVWGRFGKTAISQSFIKGIKRAIYQMKGYFFVLKALQVQMQSELFLRKYRLKFYFLTFIF